MTITFGDFGDADDEVVNAAGGQTKYNVEVSEFRKDKTLAAVPPLFYQNPCKAITILIIFDL